MRRFVLKSALFAALIAALLCVVNGAYKHTNTYKNAGILEYTARYPAMPQTVDVAVFGPSHGYNDFRTGPEGASFFNYALSSQTPQYDLMLMRQYQDRIRPGALVVLTVSYMSPFWQDTDTAFAEKQPRYYSILSPENIVNADLTQFYLQRYLPVLAAKTTDVFGAFLHDQEPLDLNEVRSISPEDIPAEQERVLKGHWEDCIALCFPETEPVMMDAFRQMLAMCAEKGWQPVLVTPPYLPAYNESFPEELFPVFYDAVDELCRQFQVPYLDYSHDEAYAGQYQLFQDIDHLNLAGAAIFDAQFYADLQAQGIWEP